MNRPLTPALSPQGGRGRKRKIQRIEDVEKPVVGERYNVPVVRWYAKSFKGQWMPVIGPKHEDADINVAIDHWHFDVRFLTEREIDRMSTISMVPPLGRILRVEMGNDAEPIARRVRIMRREMPDFPAWFNGSDIDLVATLEKKFRHVKTDCRTCPHRGMPIHQLPRKDGMVVCNGHGLRWNMETGELAPRLTGGNEGT